MIYAKIDNNTIGQIGSLHELFPNVSFPGDGPSVEWQQLNSIVEVVESMLYDHKTERVEVCQPTIKDGKVYTCTKVLISDSDKETIRLNEVEGQWFNIRNERNQRLLDCDWTQLPDSPVSQYDWAEYRQKLRNITTQTDPFNIDWPTKP